MGTAKEKFNLLTPYYVPDKHFLELVSKIEAVKDGFQKYKREMGYLDSKRILFDWEESLKKFIKKEFQS